MRFGEIAIDEAAGAILAHRVDGARQSFKKGHKLGVADLDDLKAAAVSHVLAARLDADDVGEDDAARSVADKLGGPAVQVAKAFTGRANLFASTAGVLRFDAAKVHELNRIDERITLATLPLHEPVQAGQMLATVKIIPFSVPRSSLDRALAIAADISIEVVDYKLKSAALIQTTLPRTSEKVLNKTVRVTSNRLQALGIDRFDEHRCHHERQELRALIIETMAKKPDLLLITGASAITDRADILPRAIEDAGGQVDYFGMPVDPGNLLLLAHIGDVPVLGMPGCARSPKLNGFDWVLQRLVAGMAVTPADIQAMGVGGLLSEIPTRPQPRRQPPNAEAKPQIAGIVLAAGQSRRMGIRNKLLIRLNGKSLVRHAIDALDGAGLRQIIVVSGHQAAALEQELEGVAVTIVHNPDYATGLASSLKCGLEALSDDVDAVIVALGDMPMVDAALIRRLIEAFDAEQNRTIIVPTVNGKRGNPVLWAERYFDEMKTLEGDVGAKHLIGLHAEHLFEVACQDGASLLDLDTPEALAAFEATS